MVEDDGEYEVLVLDRGEVGVDESFGDVSLLLVLFREACNSAFFSFVRNLPPEPLALLMAC